MPRRLSLSNPPRSFCPTCKHSLGFFDLFPLLSWLLLRGRCRYCREKVSARYFVVEMVAGTVWAAIWYRYFIEGWDPGRGIAYAFASAALIAIVFIDWELYIIPDEINAFLVPVGIAFNVWLYTQGSPDAVFMGMPSCLAGWIAGVGVLWAIALLGRLLFRKDAMGHGDIKMARGIGAFLFPMAALISFGLAVILGAVLGSILLGIRYLMERNARVAYPEEEEEPLEPEPLGSLLKCGLGYMLGLDIIGLFVPRLYESWFSEPADVALEEMDDFDPEPTAIPFGPYLAVGAIAYTIFGAQIQSAIDSYWRSATGGVSLLEQFHHFAGQII